MGSFSGGGATQAEVRSLLGEPQATSSGNLVAGPNAAAEIWTYTKKFYRDAAEKGFGYALARAMVNPYDSGYDRVEVSVLMITFDQSGRVMGHTFSTAAAGAALRNEKKMNLLACKSCGHSVRVQQGGGGWPPHLPP